MQDHPVMINDRLSGSVVRLRGLLAEQQHDDIQTLMGRCYCCWWCFSLAAGRVPAADIDMSTSGGIIKNLCGRSVSLSICEARRRGLGLPGMLGG
jgi:hypothetical protein